MSSLLDFLLEYKYYFIAALLAAAAVVTILVLRRKGKRAREAEMSRIHYRNEALAEALGNPMNRGRTPGRANEPLEISWDDRTGGRGDGRDGGTMMELVELSAYSRRKYVFRADDTVTIGSDDGNRLVIFREGVERRHCVIRPSSGGPCVQSASGARTVLHRGRKAVLVGEGGILLNSGDQLELGASVVQFRLFRA